MPRYDAEWIGSMMSAERARQTRPRRLLRAAGAQPGVDVVDYGAGPGFFALPAAQIVGPTGRVKAVEVEPRMHDEIRRRAREAGLRNVEPITPEAAARLPDGWAGLVIAALFLHDFPPERRDELLPELRRLCAPDGRLLVVEWVAPGGLAGPSTPNRFAVGDLAGLLRRHGFRPGRPRRLGESYFSILGRPT
ncbi:MAG TPA: class I SAM-dependent methyltransferase [Chloroflexota bacterium]|nr:class I SAM-dependent methyltransferase [Chloroflexota bacterium]